MRLKHGAINHPGPRRAASYLKQLCLYFIMAHLQYTAVHVRNLLNLSRTELQRWLSALPPFSLAPTQARTARTFTIADLAFISIVAVLHERLGLPLRTIATFSAALYGQVDARAALAGSAIRFFVNQVEDGSWQVGPETRGILSLTVDPVPVWESVYQFVGVALPAQRELALGLVSLPQSSEMEHLHARRAR